MTKPVALTDADLEELTLRVSKGRAPAVSLGFRLRRRP